MARSFSNTKLVSSFIANEISSVVTRRGYAAAAASQVGISNAVRSGASSVVMFQKGPEEPVKVSWVPDPVTGYYRPENLANEIDPVELRAMLVKNRVHKFQN